MRSGDGLGHGGEGGITLAVKDEAVLLDLDLQDHALVAPAQERAGRRQARVVCPGGSALLRSVSFKHGWTQSAGWTETEVGVAGQLGSAAAGAAGGGGFCGGPVGPG